MAKKRVLSDEEELMAVQLRGEPELLSIDKIATRLFCSTALVRAALAKHNVGSPNDKLFKPKLTPQQIAFAGARLRLDGASIHVLGKQFKVSPKTLRKCLVAASILSADDPEAHDQQDGSALKRGQPDVPNMLMARCARLPLPFPAGAIAA
jgi:hypothetical protein